MTFTLALVIVALSGFISLSYEIFWYRAFSFVSGGAPAVFGLLLGSYLFGLAGGAWFSRIWCRDRTATGNPGQLRALAGFVFVATVVGMLVVPALAWIVTFASWAIALPLVAVSAAMFGAALPLISHFGIAPDRLAGARLSYLYLANIVGSAAGSLLTGFVFMDVWRTRTIGLILALLGLGMTAGLLLAGRVRGWSLAGALGGLAGASLLAVLGTPLLYDDLYVKLLYKRLYTSDLHFEDLVETRSGVVAVTQWNEIFGGGVYDGMISTGLVHDRNAIVRAYAVAAMHARPREVLVIGLSGAAWTQVLANMPGVERVTAVEINPGYLDVVRRHPEVASLLDNPRVEVVVDDGRRWLNRHPERTFDVIVANQTFHWRAHATNLLSREFLELVRGHLRPGGLYHFNTTDSELAMKTAFTVFPHGLRYMNFVTVSDTPIRFDVERWRRALAFWRLDGVPVFDLSRADHRARLDQVLAIASTLDGEEYERDALESRERVLARVGGARVITDDNMATEWGRVFADPWGPWIPEATLLESAPFSLVQVEGREVLVSPAGDSARVEPNRLQGFLDQASLHEDTVFVTGWAADVRKARPADSLAIFLDGSFLALGTTGSARPDLVEGFGDEGLRRAGFAYPMPLRVFKGSRQPQVRAFALARGGLASELRYGSSFPWPASPGLASDPYSLVGNGRRELLVSPRGDSIPVATTSVRGVVDNAVMRGETALVVGWAADVANAQPADSLLVFLNGSFLALATTGSERPDLVASLGTPGLARAGFSLSFPARLVRGSARPTMRVFALSGSGLASELRYGRRFPWTPRGASTDGGGE